MAANIFQSGGVNNNWNTTGNWSLGAVPTASDGNIATFNASSPNCTVNIAAVCNNIDFTGYTNTITMTNGITVSGNITLGSSMLISGAGGLTSNGSGTWISNNKTWPNSMTVSATATITISSFMFTIGGTLTLSAATTFAGAYGFNTTTGTSASHIILTSSSAGTYAILTLTGTQDNGFLDGTWIDSSNGQTIWTYNGILSNILNWQDLSYFPVNTSFTFLGGF